MRNLCRCWTVNAVCIISLLMANYLSGATRQQNPKKVGLVLSGGGARGAAHIGILKILEREQIPIDLIVGTSFGAVVGGLYCMGYSAAEIEQIFLRQDWNRLFSDTPERRFAPLVSQKSLRYMGQVSFQGWSPEVPTGLYGGQKLTEELDRLTTERIVAAHYDFDQLTVRFRAVATNLLDGKAYIFERGSMTEALRASIAIPMLFTPLSKDGMLLVDGGLSDNLPTDIAREMGADIVIASDVTSPLLTKSEIKTFVDVLDQSLSLLMTQSVVRNKHLADLTINPDLHGFSYSNYTLIRPIEERGEQEAEKRLPDVKKLLAGIPGRPHLPWKPSAAGEIIESISFQGLERVKPEQLRSDVRSRQGGPINAQLLSEDLGRLYATRLFERVDYSLEPAGENRYRLLFKVKEAPRHTLGASIRYDNTYKFVALAEFTAHQLFGSQSTLTLSSQFGGFENHYAALRYIPPFAPFLFVEPKVHVLRRERLDFRDKELVDRFTDKRSGGEFLVGGTFLKRLEIAVGYTDDSVSIAGGAAPNQLSGSVRAAGPTLRINRDTLDSQDFPHSGMTIRLQGQQRSKSFGSDLSYSLWQGDFERYFSPTRKSTLRIGLSAGISRGTVPFYDKYYLGGYTYSEGGPRRVFGLDRDELAVNQMGILAASYRRLIYSRPLSFIRHIYASGYYNAVAHSDREESPYHFAVFNGAGIGLALDTLLGPLRVAGGWGEGGRLNFYLSLGPAF
ncbi:MAG TPA: patatin-like phospholipase family protein [Acidobacteriota bacterium]|nr:patatin-like phospholipase family protein [Acidobacteriota bacterium]